MCFWKWVSPYVLAWECGGQVKTMRVKSGYTPEYVAQSVRLLRRCQVSIKNVYISEDKVFENIIKAIRRVTENEKLLLEKKVWNKCWVNICIM
ncbi:hypothetical protein FKM82_020426 [Ascaphus truei]